MRLKLPALVLVGALAACQTAGRQGGVLPPDGVTASTSGSPFQIAPKDCRARVNDTVQKLEQCIQRASLWSRLSHFQKIADANPGSQGHGNRDTGTAGYAASVAYVASLMRHAGYHVTIQRYVYEKSLVQRAPELRTPSRRYTLGRDWFVARGSGSGDVTAAVEAPAGLDSGCAPNDFAGFTAGRIALVERGECDFDTQVANARTAGAAAVILYTTQDQGAYEGRLIDPAVIPVAGVASYAVGHELLKQSQSGKAAVVRIDIRLQRKSDVDYNLIADSPFGDPHHLVVLDAHLDAIYGAGILDNASGSTTILEVALNMAKTPTRNRLRYMWFGGEELGLLGSRYYTTHLTQQALHDIAFDIDTDVTATPNFDILIADPRFASKVKLFPPNVVPQSKVGNVLFTAFFKTGGIVSRAARFGNDGTDSLSFSLAGVPNTGILTQQDCCKHAWETQLWGGFLGNYEGAIPSFNGGCVDQPHRWCDNLSNNDPFVLELASKAVAFVTFELANRHFP
jgi:hypothetical protein